MSDLCRSLIKSLKNLCTSKKGKNSESSNNKKLSGIIPDLVASRKIVFLGVGNIERGDDSAGCLVIQELKKIVGKRKDKKILLLDGGESPESLTGEIRAFGPDLTAIVDAAVAGHEPGTVYIVDRDKISQDDLTTHRMPLTLLICYLEESVGCRVIMIGIEPKNLRLGDRVSEEVKASVQILSEQLARIMKA